MESHLISKMSNGFTLIEMVLILAIVSFVAVASVALSLPTIGRFSCIQETAAIRLALERARHISQFSNSGDVRLEIMADQYEISALGHDASQSDPVVVDQVDRRVAVHVAANREIRFLEHSGALSQDSSNSPSEPPLEISIGGQDFGCEQHILINNAGTIL